MRIVGIVQARMGSSRLPGKVLEEVSGRALLDYQLRRLKACEQLDDLMVATSVKGRDDVICALCSRADVSVYRGSEENVLERYIEAATVAKAEAVVRLTADCPLIDPSLVDAVVKAYRHHTPPYDYFSNTLDRGFPRGMDVEIIAYGALQAAHKAATLPEEREHVTLHLYRNPEIYRVGSFDFRLTVDTKDDLALMEKMIEDLEPTQTNPTLAELTEWHQRNPQVS